MAYLKEEKLDLTGMLVKCDGLDIGGTELTTTELTGLSGLDLTGLTATAAELNMAADSSANVEVVTATNVLTAAESGKTFFLNSATSIVSTLPAPAAGLRYKFVIGATAVANGQNHTVVTTSGANLIYGSAEVANSNVAASAEDTITFTGTSGTTALPGDWVEVISDGTNWYVTGMATVATAIAFTAT